MLSYKSKIFLDRTFGFVAATVMRVLTRFVGIILRRDHTSPANPSCVAVAKIVGLGSIVYTGTLCRALKKRFPQSKLIYITSKGSHELVKRMNYIDEILLIDDTTLMRMTFSTVKLIFRLWRLRPALYFDMEVYSTWAAIIATLSLALNRYGFYRKNADFKKGMHSHMLFFNTHRHIADVYSQMALCAGAEPNVKLGGLLNVTEKDRKGCCEKLLQLGLGSASLVLVNVNASDLLIERRWPAEKWVEYLVRVTREFPEFNYLLIGAKNEYGYVSSVYDDLMPQARQKVINVAGQFPFGGFLALLEMSILVVTNDSGPLHFAAALNTPTVSIWGPGAPDHYAPLLGTHSIIYNDVYCSPCLYHADLPPCRGENVCVRDIGVSQVFDATKKMIELAENHTYINELLSLGNKVNYSILKSRVFNPTVTHNDTTSKTHS